MIDYVIPENIDDRILIRAVNILKKGGLVAHPTDTSWHISCAFSSAQGLKHLKKLKNGARGCTFTLIAASIQQAAELAHISTAQYKFIRRLVPGPYVFILESTRKVERATETKRREVGIRIPEDSVCLSLIDVLGEPLFSTTAARTMDNQDWWEFSFAEENLFEMGWELESIPGLEMILDGGVPLSKTLTTVLDLKQQDVKVIRIGAGPLEKKFIESD